MAKDSIAMAEALRHDEAYGDFCQAWNAHFEQTPGWSFDGEVELLWSCARAVAAHQCIVEIGTYCGLATMALAHGAASGQSPPVYTVDPHWQFQQLDELAYGPGNLATFYRSMGQLAPELTRLIFKVSLSSQQASLAWTGMSTVSMPPIGMLWIDGNHSSQAVTQDLQAWVPHLADGGLVLLHDMHELGPWLAANYAMGLGSDAAPPSLGLQCVGRRNTIGVLAKTVECDSLRRWPLYMLACEYMCGSCFTKGLQVPLATQTR